MQLALAQRREALFLVEKAKDAMQRRQFSLATLIALEALPDADRDPDRPFVTEAALVLGKAFADVARPIGEPMRHEDRVTSAAFSPDGERIVTASSDSTARLWDSGTGRPIGAPMRHEGVVVSAAFSPDGERVVTASDDRTARLWDSGTGGPAGEPMRHEDGVTSAAFSPDGERIATASDDRTARLWQPFRGTSEDYIAHVRRSMVRCLTAEERKDLYLEPVADIKAKPDYCRPREAH